MNNRFLEQYKRADNLCRDMYNSESGITNYINLMRDAKNYREQEIAEWDSVLARLLALRHIRNKLTHDVGTLEMELCHEEDILWLEEFCESLLESSDPLSKHYRAFNQKKREPKKKTGTKTVSTEPVFKTTSLSRKKRKRLPPVIKALGFLALVTLAFYLLIELYRYIGA